MSLLSYRSQLIEGPEGKSTIAMKWVHYLILLLLVLYTRVTSVHGNHAERTSHPPQPQSIRQAFADIHRRGQNLGNNPELSTLGYDCSSPHNIVDSPLRRSSQCAYTRIAHTQSMNYQLLHSEKAVRVQGWKCSVMVSSTTSYCGTADHSTPMYDNSVTYENKPFNLKPQFCNEIIHARKVDLLRHFKQPGDEYPLNSVEYQIHVPGVTSVGYVAIGKTYVSNGHLHCEGSTLRVPYDNSSYINAGVQFKQIRIQISEESYKYQFNEERLYATISNTKLPVQCPIEQGHCEADYNTFVWPQLYLSQYCPLALGTKFQASHYTSNHNDSVIISTDESLIKIRPGAKVKKCGHLVLSTNFPNTYVVPAEQAKSVTNRTIHPSEVDLYDLVSGKDDFLFHKMQSLWLQEVKTLLYYDCLQRHQDSHIVSYLQSTGDAEFSYGNGSFAIAAGDILYEFRCTPVIVIPQPYINNTCYEEIRVHVPMLNESRYLTRFTHLITTKAVQIPCDTLTLFVPKIQTVYNTWYSILGVVLPTTPPSNSRLITPRWQPKERDIDFSKGGLYSRKNVRALQEFLELGVMRKGLGNRLLMQSNIHNQHGHIAPTQLFAISSDWEPISSSSFIGGLMYAIKCYSEFTSVILSFYITYRIIVWVLSMSYKIKLLQPIYGFVHSLFWSLVPDILLLKERYQRKQPIEPITNATAPVSDEPAAKRSRYSVYEDIPVDFARVGSTNS